MELLSRMDGTVRIASKGVYNGWKYQNSIKGVWRARFEGKQVCQ